MTLFGGNCPQHDVVTEPDCMVGYVHNDLLWGLRDEDACGQTETPEGVFAWACLFANCAIVSELEDGTLVELL